MPHQSLVSRAIERFFPPEGDIDVAREWLAAMLLIASNNKLPEIRISPDTESEGLIAVFYKDDGDGLYEERDGDFHPVRQQTMDSVRPLQTEAAAFRRLLAKNVRNLIRIPVGNRNTHFGSFNTLTETGTHIMVSAYLHANDETVLVLKYPDVH